ncbi:ATP-binding protein [Haliscomenobacter sp.]|uniref:ATP-binding protein n=1 Tax=Haliscomenobacter sp. TaxID=2717303 RepID=UPI0035930D85
MFTGEGFVKSGAVLFFGKAPETYFEKAIIRCVAFSGTNKRYIIDDKPFGGPLYAQYLKAILWLREKLDVRYDIEGQGSGPRNEIWEIPETVFKEAIINYLSHRDYYDKGAVTTVELFTDRIEISNPDGLVSAISPADFGKRSHSRNPLIFGLFAKMHLVEQIGSGINRMNESMKATNLPLPQYSTEGMFTVTFQRPLKTVEKTSEEKILLLIKSNAKTTSKEMMRETGLTRRGVEYLLNKLKENGTIQRVGADKGGYWQLTN